MHHCHVRRYCDYHKNIQSSVTWAIALPHLLPLSEYLAELCWNSLGHVVSGAYWRRRLCNPFYTHAPTNPWLTIPLLDCFYIHVCYDMTTSEWMRHDKIRKVGYLTFAWLDAEWVTLFLLCACSWMAMVWQKCLNPHFKTQTWLSSSYSPILSF